MTNTPKSLDASTRNVIALVEAIAPLMTEHRLEYVDVTVAPMLGQSGPTHVRVSSAQAAQEE